MTLIVTEDLPTCPRCDSPATKTGERTRICNACGLAWERKTAEDEADIEADQAVRTREYAEERGRVTSIGKGQQRW